MKHLTTFFLYIAFLISTPVNAQVNSHDTCSVILNHIKADTLSEIEVPLSEIQKDFDEDGHIDQLTKRSLGSSQSISLGYINREGAFILIGTCCGCGSATTNSIKVLEIDNELYVLQQELDRWSFSYPFLETSKPELCSFKTKYKPRLRRESDICHKILKGEWQEIDFEEINKKSGFDWDFELREKNEPKGIKKYHPASFIESYPKKMDINNDGEKEEIVKVFEVWMGGRYISNNKIMKINDFEERTYDKSSDLNQSLAKLYENLPFAQFPEYYFSVNPIILNDETFLSVYSEFHTFWNIYQIKNKSMKTVCEFDLESSYNLYDN